MALQVGPPTRDSPMLQLVICAPVSTICSSAQTNDSKMKNDPVNHGGSSVLPPGGASCHYDYCTIDAQHDHNHHHHINSTPTLN